MLNQIQGLHHVTSMAGDARANNAFFTDTLGLRRVKKTVNFDAPEVYHLYYGDEVGTPGSVMTYFPFPHIAGRHKGTGEVGQTAFAVPKGAIPFWRDRLVERGAKDIAEDERFGERRLTFTGPDGDEFALVEVTDPRQPWTHGGVPDEAAIRGFHGASLRLRDAGATDELLRFMGYTEAEKRDGITRLVREGGNGADVVDIETLPGAPAAESRRRLGPPHRLRGAGPGGATRSAQGAARHRLPGDAGDRPRLLLGYLLPHARRGAVRGGDERAGLRP